MSKREAATEALADLWVHADAMIPDVAASHQTETYREFLALLGQVATMTGTTYGEVLQQRRDWQDG
jgi:hypothetical protein